MPTETEEEVAHPSGHDSMLPLGVLVPAPIREVVCISGSIYVEKISVKYGETFNIYSGENEIAVCESVWNVRDKSDGSVLETVRIGEDYLTLWRAAERYVLFENENEREAARFEFTYRFDPIAAPEEYAKYLYETGQALRFLCESCGRVHVGDRPAIMSMFLSYASTRVTNGTGIHISISGDAGTGKSHAAMTVAKRLPQDSVITDRLSDKALFYHEIKPRTVLILDDQELTEDFQELLKISTTNWGESGQYRTVQNGKAALLTMAPRCPFWVCKANLTGDEQVLDRQLLFWTDNSTEQRRAIQNVLFAEATGEESSSVAADVAVCRALWFYVQDAAVVVPYTRRIYCDEFMDPRNIKLLLALVEAAALMDAGNRDRDSEGRVIATEEDFRTAADEIMNPLLHNHGGSQRLKLSSGGAAILEFLAGQPKGLVFFGAVRRATGFSQSKLSYSLYGRDGRPGEGLLSVCPALEVVYHTESDGGGIDDRDSKRKSISRKAIKWSPESYQSWMTGLGGFTLYDHDVR